MKRKPSLVNPRGRHRRKRRRAVRTARPMKMLDEEGVFLVDIRDSRTASRVGGYWSAIDYYLRSGSADRLEEFEGGYVTAGRRRYPFLTNRDEIERFARAGEISFTDIYESP